MQDEIDLRPYINALLESKWILMGATLAGALVAVALSLLTRGTYEATSLVAVLEPTQIIQLDPRFQTIQNETQLLRAYPELARSDGLMQALLESPAAEEFEGVGQLRASLVSEAASDPGLLRLRARHSDPQTAMQLANEWANLFIAWVDQAYGGAGSVQYEFFYDQLRNTQQRLALAEDALVEFQSENQLAAIENELTAMNALQQEYFGRLNALTLLLEDIQALQAQLESGALRESTLAAQLTILGLQSKAFGTQDNLPIVLQLEEGELATATSAEQIRLLESLSDAVAQMAEDADENASALVPEILQLQQTSQRLQTELNDLTRNQELLEETTASLARKVDEESIAAQESSGGVRLVSEASLPVTTTGPGTLILAAIGGLFGLVLGSFIVIIARWWRQ